MGAGWTWPSERHDAYFVAAFSVGRLPRPPAGDANFQRSGDLHGCRSPFLPRSVGSVMGPEEWGLVPQVTKSNAIASAAFVAAR
eukprot:1468578-Pyramimonas_sp.AAC.1